MADERVERRLAAILAADVAEYSRLMGNDEEGSGNADGLAFERLHQLGGLHRPFASTKKSCVTFCSTQPGASLGELHLSGRHLGG
jgi:hypothetical protein